MKGRDGSWGKPRPLRGRFLDAPEVNIAIFAFLLNFPWEFLQVPFFAEMATAEHWPTVQFCTGAALGDAVIALAGFGAVAGFRSRSWVLHPSRGEIIAFTGVGLAITVVLEWLATDVLGRWAYASTMPTLPVLGTGLLPIAQWTILPPLIIWFARRQIT